MNSPLTAAQKRFWFMSQYFSGTDTYNMSLGLTLNGVLDVDHLQQSLKKLIQSNPILGLFINDGAVPTQTVSAIESFPELPLYIESLNDHATMNRSAEERDSLLKSLQIKYFQQPIPLDKPYLWRLIYIQLSDKTSCLYLVMHHVMTDAWSLSVFFKKLSDIYLNIHEDKWFDQHFLSTAYKDEQAYYDDVSRLQGDVHFWENYLQHTIDKLIFLGKELNPKQNRDAHSIYHTLSNDALRDIRRFAAKRKASVYIVLLASFSLLLLRTTGHKNCLVGTMVSGRDNVTEPDAMGCYANIIPVLFLDPQHQTINQYLDVLLNDWYDIYEHQSLPFQNILEASRKSTQSAPLELVENLFVMQNNMQHAEGLFNDPVASFDPFEHPRKHAEFPLFMLVRESSQGLCLSLQYNANIFPEEYAQYLLGAYAHIVLKMCQDENDPVKDYLSANSSDKKLFSMINATHKNYPETSLFDLFSKSLSTLHHKIAIHAAQRTLSYAALNQRIQTIANYLYQHGIHAGESIGVSLAREPDLIATLLAIWRLNCAYVPVEHTFPDERKKKIIAIAKLRWIVTQDETAQTFEFCKTAVINLSRLEESHERVTTLPPLKTNLNFPAYGLFTSGSTGEPKYIVIFQKNVFNYFCWAKNYFPPELATGVSAGTALTFDHSLIEFFIPLLFGGKVILLENHLHYHDSPHREEIVTISGTPSAIYKIIQQDKISPKTRYILSGGEPAPHDMIDEIFKKTSVHTVYNIYGLTETTIYNTIAKFEKKIDAKTVTAGRPIANNRIYILNESQWPVPIGTPGDIYIAGKGIPDVATSINQQLLPILFDDLFEPLKDKMLKTGDVGYWNTTGELICLGRTDTQLKLHGYRLEPLEIEQTIRSYPGMKEAAVILKDDATLGPTLICYYVADTTIDVPALCKHIATYLPQYMVPKRFYALHQIPTNSNGKMDRKTLQNVFDSNEVIVPSWKEKQSTVSKTEQELMAIWQSVLNNPNMTNTDSFFLLGGHSLLIPALLKQVKERTGCKVPIANFFLYPTVKELAWFIHNGHNPSPFPKQNLLNNVPQDSLHEIAIIGYSMRLPMGNDLNSFWEFLSDKKSCVEAIPKERWQFTNPANTVCSWGTFLKNIEAFDPVFFDLSLRESKIMDPQQRLLLEVAWETLEHAGYSISSLQDKHQKVGVYIGAAINDYATLLSRAGLSTDPYFATGNSFSLLANRISYLLGLDGPSLTIDTACSAAFSALHMAIQSLRHGEINAAFVGSAAIMLIQDNYIVWNQMGILAKQKDSIPFDNDSSGFIPGEAVAGLFIKPYQQALQDKDTIYGIIKGSAINHDGRSKVGLNATSPRAQAELIQKAVANAGLQMQDMDYFETHGTGTRLGDAVEIMGLCEAVKTTNDKKFAIGTIKSQIGHTGPVAGFIGLLKMLLAFKHQTFPASRINTLNTHIDWENIPLFLNTTTTPWHNQTKRVGISAYGFGGSNAHVVVESPESIPSNAYRVDIPQVCLISAKTEQALRQAVSNLVNFLRSSSAIHLEDISYTLLVGREHFNHRLAVIAKNHGQLGEYLETFLTDPLLAKAFYKPHVPKQSEPIDASMTDPSLIIEHYLKGYKISTDNMHYSRFARRIALPTYPFQRQYCWYHEKKPVDNFVDKTSWIQQEKWQKIVFDTPATDVQKKSSTCFIYADSMALSELLFHQMSLNHSVVSISHRIEEDTAILQPIREQHPRNLHILFLATEPHQHGLQRLFLLLKSLGQINPFDTIQFTLITNQAQADVHTQPVNPDFAALWPLALSAEREIKALQVQCLDVQITTSLQAKQCWIRKIGLIKQYPALQKIMIRGETMYQATYCAIPPIMQAVQQESPSRKTIWITGGLGGIGFIVATWLLKHCDANVVLISRTAQITIPSELSNFTGRYLIIKADTSSKEEMQQAFKQSLQTFTTIDSVFHLAGIMRPGLLIKKDWEECLVTFSSKIIGPQVLCELFQERVDTKFVFFSSLSAHLGSGLLADYAAANAWMNAYVHNLNLKGRCAQSISWCGFRETGMGMTLATNASVLLDNHEALHLLQVILGLAHHQIIVAHPRSFSEQPVAEKNDIEQCIIYNTPISPAQCHANTIQSWEEWLKHQIATLTEIVWRDVDFEKSFTELGIDSILTAALIQVLNRESGLKLSPAILFEYPTVKQLSAHLQQYVPLSFTTMKTPQADVKLKPPSEIKETDVAIIGIACALPGSPHYETFWHHLISGHDLVTTHPYETLINTKKFNIMDARFAGQHFSAGFLDFSFKFSPDFFQMSIVESERIQEQQKLFLQLSYNAIENAGYTSKTLAETKVGVFVGAMPVQQKNIYQTIHPHTLLGQSNAILANRVSYFFNFTGPSITIDTLCSSSLVALHAAVQSIILGDCATALVGGVRVGFDAEYFHVTARMNALSPTGKCRSFGANTDGFVPAEGGVVLLLKPLSQAIAARDFIWGTIKGIAVNHGGRGNGLTAPNPKGQAKTIQDALEKSGLSSNAVSYIEAHGTGTELGDPIEFAGLNEAFHGRSCHLPKIGIGSVKSNVGHLEPASGLVGVLKVLLAMQHKVIPPSLHLSSVNPHLQLEKSPFYLVHKKTDWVVHEAQPRVAGISSFGIGGSNAHVIIEEASPRQRPIESATPQFFLLSARSPEALQQMIINYMNLLSTDHDQITLEDLSYTLAMGRDHYEYRIAEIVTSKKTLLEKLSLLKTSNQAMQKLKLYKPVSFGLNLHPCSLKTLDWDMIQTIYKSCHFFAELINQCDQLLKQLSNHSLLDLLFDPTHMSLHQEPASENLLVFCLLYVNGRLITHYTNPDKIQGEGVGYDVAACLSGENSLETTLQNVMDRELSYSLLQDTRPTFVSYDHTQWLNLSPLMNYLDCLCILHKRGVPILWQLLYQNSQGKRTPLPAYPFTVEEHFKIQAPLEETL